MSGKSAKRQNGDENCSKNRKNGFAADLQTGKSIEIIGASEASSLMWEMTIKNSRRESEKQTPAVILLLSPGTIPHKWYGEYL